MKLQIKKLHADAIVPRMATEGAACFDLHAMLSDLSSDATIIVHPGTAQVFRTGLAFDITAGFAMLIYSRSGHGFKNDVRLSNSVGVIDSDYRGEVHVKLCNDGTEPFYVKNGDRIAQAMIQMLPQVQFAVVEELSETARGAGGFGSTGA